MTSGAIQTNGTIQQNANFKYTNIVSVAEGDTISCFNGSVGISANLRSAFFYVDGVYANKYNTTQAHTMTIPADVNGVAFNINNSVTDPVLVHATQAHRVICDTTLTKVDIPADAKTVGDELETKLTSDNIKIVLTKGDVVTGSLVTSTMGHDSNVSCVAYLTKIPVNGGETIKIEAPTISGVSYYKYRFGFYDSTGAYLGQMASQTSNTTTVGANVRFISFHVQGFDSSDNAVTFNVRDAFSATDVINVVYTDRWVELSDIALSNWVSENFAPKGKGGYTLDVNNMKHGVSSQYLGDIKYLQAFCIYDGKYYSIDGSNIAEQSADFTVLRDVALNTGHGNSLQLGSNGIAYTYGWDNNTIYAIDLATLTIAETITIPTTGYTTGVVDDVNEIAYILQRDTDPNTIDTYNFIAYDYGNEQVINSKKVNAFSALQDCDFLYGKIIVAYGMGTEAKPNGITVYNTVGDILSTYDLDIFDITEIEGIAYNRTGDGIYVSLWNKNLYKIT